MWYLYGLLISLLVFIILPIVRYRSYWNRVLKDPKAQNQNSLDMLGEHIVCSFFICKRLTYEDYRGRVLYAGAFDTFDLCLFIFMFLLLTVIWMITLPLLIIIWIVSAIVKLLQRSIDRKIQANSQNE